MPDQPRVVAATHEATLGRRSRNSETTVAAMYCATCGQMLYMAVGRLYHVVGDRR